MSERERMQAHRGGRAVDDFERVTTKTEWGRSKVPHTGICSTPRQERLSFVEGQTKPLDCYFREVCGGLPCLPSPLLQVLLEIVVSV